MPDIGYHVRWYGVWMEIAEGVSLENLLKVGVDGLHGLGWAAWPAVTVLGAQGVGVGAGWLAGWLAGKVAGLEP
jgi:hypothetical protein